MAKNESGDSGCFGCILWIVVIALLIFAFKAALWLLASAWNWNPFS